MPALLMLLALQLGPDGGPKAAAESTQPTGIWSLAVDEAIRLAVSGPTPPAAADPAPAPAAATPAAAPEVLAREVERAYWGLWLAHARVAARETALAQVEEFLSVQEVRRELGEGKPSDLAVARRAAESARKVLEAETGRAANAEVALRRAMRLPASGPARIVPSTSPGSDAAGDDGVVDLVDALDAGPDALMRKTDDRRMKRRLAEVDALTAARIAARNPAGAPAVDPNVRRASDRAASRARLELEAGARQMAAAAAARQEATRRLGAARDQVEEGASPPSALVDAIDRHTGSVVAEAEARARQRVASAELLAETGKLLERRGIAPDAPRRDVGVKPASGESPAADRPR